MPVERSDKLIREKIEGLDNLPAGFRLHAGASWKELEQKLHTPKRNGFAWWYAAAAILLIMASTFLWNSYFLQSPDLPTAAVKADPAPVKQVVPTTNLERDPVKNVSARTHLKKEDAPVIINELTKTDTAVQNAVVISERPVATPLISNTTSIAATTPKTTAKKRLKVVHINELGTEPEILYSKVPLKRNQQTEDNADELLPSQNPRSWWQTKPKTVTTVTVSDNN